MKRWMKMFMEVRVKRAAVGEGGTSHVSCFYIHNLKISCIINLFIFFI
jgi:hypothetical protein